MLIVLPMLARCKKAQNHDIPYLMSVRPAIEYFVEVLNQKIGNLRTDVRSEQLIAVQLSIVKGRDMEIMNTAEFDWHPGISLGYESLGSV
jgi:hypothetical protein